MLRVQRERHMSGVSGHASISLLKTGLRRAFAVGEPL